jgi:hypothetical protein
VARGNLNPRLCGNQPLTKGGSVWLRWSKSTRKYSRVIGDLKIRQYGYGVNPGLAKWDTHRNLPVVHTLNASISIVNTNTDTRPNRTLVKGGHYESRASGRAHCNKN